MSTHTKASSPFDPFEKLLLSIPLKAVTPFKRVIMTAWMVITDVVALMITGWLSIQIRYWMGGTYSHPSYYYALAPLLTIFIFAYAIAGMYPVIGLTPAEELKRTTSATSAAMVALSVIAFLTQTGVEYSRLVFVFFWVLALFAVPFSRLMARKIGFALGIWGEPVALIGFGVQGRRIYQYLRQNPLCGIRPVVIINDMDHKESDTGEKTGLPEISASIIVKDKQFLARSGIHSAILIPNEIPVDLRDALVDEQQFGLQRLILISSLNWIGSSAVIPHDMGGMLGLEVERNLLNAPERLLKRILDFFMLIFAFLIGIPIFLFCAVMILIDSRGPVFYRHERIGKDGRKIRLWKFRTMVANADEILKKQLRENSELRKEWESHHKLKNDPRATRFGRLLRKTSLDEFPQIINILAGEMSFVGPRPIVESEVKFYTGGFHLYSQVLPGITGLWQVSGRSNTSYKDRVTMDEYYIRHWSIWMDIYIIIRTIGVVIKRSGAY
jgi:Undecaprenyl-phosphate galactose phosphotransferase WbaP